MARSNGKLPEKQVSAWFSEMDFDKQHAFLGSSIKPTDSAEAGEDRRAASAARGIETGRGRAIGKRARKSVRRKARRGGEIPRSQNGRYLVRPRPHGAMAGREGLGGRESR